MSPRPPRSPRRTSNWKPPPPDRRRPRRRSRRAARADARRDHRADLVVLLALLGVAEHVVRGRDLLEALLGLVVAGVRVGVELLRELLVGARDLLVGRALAARRAPRSSPSRTTLAVRAICASSLSRSLDLHHRGPQHAALRACSRCATRRRRAARRRRRPASRLRARSGRTARRRPSMRSRPAVSNTATSSAYTSSTPLRTFSSASPPRLRERASSKLSSTGSRSARPDPRSPARRARSARAACACGSSRSRPGFAAACPTQLVAFARRASSKVGLDGPRPRRRPFGLGTVVVGGTALVSRDRVRRAPDPVRFAVSRHAQALCSSSTISASATSSSSGWRRAAPPRAPASAVLLRLRGLRRAAARTPGSP